VRLWSGTKFETLYGPVPLPLFATFARSTVSLIFTSVRASGRNTLGWPSLIRI
jgi:hypothetical protein